jgi:DNA-binding beta-propeller fold protein YncE
MGLAVSPDNRLIYVAGGQVNKVYLFDMANGAPAGEIDCSYKDATVDYSHGYIGDMTLTKDGKTLYAVDQINFRMLIIHTQAR